MDTATKTFSCEMTVPGDKICGHSGPADDMWNISKRHTRGKLVVLCGKHARVCRNEPHNMHVFRLSETLRREKEEKEREESERQASSAFFQSLKNFRAEDEGGDPHRRNGHTRDRRHASV